MDDREILISQFIDDELSADEKEVFVREVHENDGFYDETLSMLSMEKDLSADSIPALPDLPQEKKHWVSPAMAASFAALAASVAVMVKVFFFVPQPVQEVKLYQRFVIHAPDAANVALTGSFSEWRKLSMKSAGNGYWEITVPLNKGEYTYSYIINGKQQVPDPSVAAKVTDDFGGENSVIDVGDNI